MTSATGEKGYTLVELFLVITLLGLLSMLAWPSLRSLAAHSQAGAAGRKLVSALHQAKMRAVVSGQTQTVLLPSSAGQATFFADGSATAAVVSFGSNEKIFFEVSLEETGRLIFHEKS